MDILNKEVKMTNEEYIIKTNKRKSGLIGSVSGGMIGVIMILIFLPYMDTSTMKNMLYSDLLLCVIFSLSVLSGVTIANKIFKRWTKK